MVYGRCLEVKPKSQFVHTAKYHFEFGYDEPSWLCKECASQIGNEAIREYIDNMVLVNCEKDTKETSDGSKVQKKTSGN